jgi:hypothetical protein
VSTIKKYSSPPSPLLLEKIGATNLETADAVAEIVANSFDAAIDGTSSRIEVTIASDEISVVDNGSGMSEQVLIDAVRLGVDMSRIVTKREGAKGRFGLGMKTACASMGRWWRICTRPVGENREYRVVFDLAEWQQRPDTSEAWTFEIESIDSPSDGPLGNRPHGTALTVRRLRARDPMAGAVLKKLGEAFKPHLEAGDAILVNGDPATPHVYRFVPGSKIPIDLRFGPKNQLRITGWVALDTQTHNDGQYGFNIYRHGQLVQTWNQNWFDAHLMTSRIIGEAHMDFIDATFFKQGLQQNDVWKLASKEMEQFLKPIVRASRDLSRKGNIRNPVARKKIIDDLRAEAGAGPAEAVAVPEISAGDDETDGAEEPVDKEITWIRVDEQRLVLEDGTEVPLSLLEKRLGSTEIPYDYIPDRHAGGLQTVLNTAHPLFLASRDQDQLRVVAVADSIVRFLVNERTLTNRQAADIRNKWITAAMKKSGGGGGA